MEIIEHVFDVESTFLDPFHSQASGSPSPPLSNPQSCRLASRDVSESRLQRVQRPRQTSHVVAAGVDPILLGKRTRTHGCLQHIDTCRRVSLGFVRHEIQRRLTRPENDPAKGLIRSSHAAVPIDVHSEESLDRGASLSRFSPMCPGAQRSLLKEAADSNREKNLGITKRKPARLKGSSRMVLSGPTHTKCNTQDFLGCC